MPRVTSSAARGVGVPDVEEGRQQAAGVASQREVPLVALHRRHEHGVGQAQVTLAEGAARDRWPLREIHGLGEHVAGVRPLAAHLGGGGVQPLDDEPSPLLMGDDHALLREALLVVLRGVHDGRSAQHAVTRATGRSPEDRRRYR